MECVNRKPILKQQLQDKAKRETALNKRAMALQTSGPMASELEISDWLLTVSICILLIIWPFDGL